MKIGKKNIELKWMGHAGFMIRASKVVYIDPYKINLEDNMPKADIILLTHSHYDHCNSEDISKIVKEGTKILAPADCQSKIARTTIPVNIRLVEPGQELDFGDVRVTVFPAYNVDKSFHSKDESWVGYLVKINGVFIYHAGDTDKIPEMQKLTGYKSSDSELIALLPVGGRFTMTAEEAAEAAVLIKPTLAIPMHYGSVAGTEEDAIEFKELCELEKIKVEILKKE